MKIEELLNLGPCQERQVDDIAGVLVSELDEPLLHLAKTSFVEDFCEAHPNDFLINHPELIKSKTSFYVINSDIIFSLMLTYPSRGGGPLFCEPAVVGGKISWADRPSIFINSLRLGTSMHVVDLTQGAIEAGRVRFSKLFDKNMLDSILFTQDK